MSENPLLEAQNELPKTKNPDLSENLKESSDWPGIPQLLEAVQYLVDELQTSKQTQRAMQLILDAVLHNTKADMVFWYSGSSHEVELLVGEKVLSPGECKQLAEKVKKQKSGETMVLLASIQKDRPLVSGTSIFSLIMARMEPNGSCLMAVGLDLDQPLCESDQKLVQLAISLFRQQWTHNHIYSRFQDALVGLVQAFATTIDAKDSYTAGHSERVARIAMTIGQQMKLTRKELGDVYLGGLLHDIGKIGIRDDVLKKPGKLTDEEFAHICEHTIIGYNIISKIKQFSHLRAAIRNHHERFDGKGYPDKLAGYDIPLLARLMCVADACDALMSPRRYRETLTLTPPQIDKIMMEEAGKQLDADIVEHFMACREKIYPPIYQKGIGDSAYHAIDSAMLADMEMEG